MRGMSRKYKRHYSFKRRSQLRHKTKLCSKHRGVINLKRPNVQTSIPNAQTSALCTNMVYDVRRRVDSATEATSIVQVFDGTMSAGVGGIFAADSSRQGFDSTLGIVRGEMTEGIDSVRYIYLPSGSIMRWTSQPSYYLDRFYVLS